MFSIAIRISNGPFLSLQAACNVVIDEILHSKQIFEKKLSLACPLGKRKIPIFGLHLENDCRILTATKSSNQNFSLK